MNLFNVKYSARNVHRCFQMKLLSIKNECLCSIVKNSRDYFDYSFDRFENSNIRCSGHYSTTKTLYLKLKQFLVVYWIVYFLSPEKCQLKCFPMFKDKQTYYLFLSNLTVFCVCHKKLRSDIYCNSVFQNCKLLKIKSNLVFISLFKLSENNVHC